MYSLYKVVAVFAIFYAYEASQDIYSGEGVGMNWTVESAPEFEKYRRLEPIYDMLIGNDNHSLVIQMCENRLETHPKNCELVIRTHKFDNNIHTKICKIHPPSENEYDEVETDQAIFLRGDRVLVSWKTHHKNNGWRMAFRIIFTENCKESDFIYLYTDRTGSSSSHHIIRFKKVFDIIFADVETCSDYYYCKVTYNYDGIPINSLPSPFSTEYVTNKEMLLITSTYTMNYGNEEGPILTGRKLSDYSSSYQVYSPVLGWTQKNYSAAEVYSNSSGFATLCWEPIKYLEELQCKWLDGTQGNNTITYSFGKSFRGMPDIYNAANGNIMVVKQGHDGDAFNKIFVDEYGTDGHCKRVTIIDAFETFNIQNLRLSMPQENNFCVSYITYTCKSKLCYDRPLFYYYRFFTRCVRVNADDKKHVECGLGYF